MSIAAWLVDSGMWPSTPVPIHQRDTTAMQSYRIVPPIQFHELEREPACPVCANAEVCLVHMYGHRERTPIARAIRITASIDGKPAGSWDFYSDRLVIGRAPHADVKLDGDDVSREHAIVERSHRTHTLSIRDNSSVNGTYLNERRIDAAKALKAKDEVRLGAYLIRCEVV